MVSLRSIPVYYAQGELLELILLTFLFLIEPGDCLVLLGNLQVERSHVYLIIIQGEVSGTYYALPGAVWEGIG